MTTQWSVARKKLVSFYKKTMYNFATLFLYFLILDFQIYSKKKKNKIVTLSFFWKENSFETFIKKQLRNISLGRFLQFLGFRKNGLCRNCFLCQLAANMKQKICNSVNIMNIEDASRKPSTQSIRLKIKKTFLVH